MQWSQHHRTTNDYHAVTIFTNCFSSGKLTQSSIDPCQQSCNSCFSNNSTWLCPPLQQKLFHWCRLINAKWPLKRSGWFASNPVSRVDMPYNTVNHFLVKQFVVVRGFDMVVFSWGLALLLVNSMGLFLPGSTVLDVSSSFVVLMVVERILWALLVGYGNKGWLEVLTLLSTNLEANITLLKRRGR